MQAVEKKFQLTKCLSRCVCVFKQKITNNRFLVITWLVMPRDVTVYRLKTNDGNFFHWPVQKKFKYTSKQLETSAICCLRIRSSRLPLTLCQDALFEVETLSFIDFVNVILTRTVIAIELTFAIDTFCKLSRDFFNFRWARRGFRVHIQELLSFSIKNFKHQNFSRWFFFRWHTLIASL